MGAKVDPLHGLDPQSRETGRRKVAAWFSCRPSRHPGIHYDLLLGQVGQPSSAIHTIHQAVYRGIGGGSGPAPRPEPAANPKFDVFTLAIKKSFPGIFRLPQRLFAPRTSTQFGKKCKAKPSEAPAAQALIFLIKHDFAISPAHSQRRRSGAFFQLRRFRAGGGSKIQNPWRSREFLFRRWQGDPATTLGERHGGGRPQTKGQALDAGLFFQ